MIILFIHKFYQMTSEKALKWCSMASSWEDFEMRVSKSFKDIDLSFLAESHVVKIDDANNYLVDWRYIHP